MNPHIPNLSTLIYKERGDLSRRGNRFFTSVTYRSPSLFPSLRPVRLRAPIAQTLAPCPTASLSLCVPTHTASLPLLRLATPLCGSPPSGKRVIAHLHMSQPLAIKG